MQEVAEKKRLILPKWQKKKKEPHKCATLFTALTGLEFALAATVVVNRCFKFGVGQLDSTFRPYRCGDVIGRILFSSSPIENRHSRLLAALRLHLVCESIEGLLVAADDHKVFAARLDSGTETAETSTKFQNFRGQKIGILPRQLVNFAQVSARARFRHRGGRAVRSEEHVLIIRVLALGVDFAQGTRYGLNTRRIKNLCHKRNGLKG